jgi:hypothetical protein
MVLSRSQSGDWKSSRETVCGGMAASVLRLILLQKSKIEPYRKFRQSGFLGASTAATLCSADAKVRGRFCVKQ